MSFFDGSAFILKESVTAATPLLLAGFGELVAERAGVINIGIEGLMLMGCIGAYAGAVVCGSAYAGLVVAVAVGIIFAGIFALAAIWFRADQIVTGTALNILAAGASTTAWRVVQNYMNGAAPHGAPALFEPVGMGGLSRIPVLGPALFQQYGLFYFVVGVGIATWFMLRRTRIGLIVQALGDAPDAASAAGIRVRLWRTMCTLAAGGCAGLAGAYLSTMRSHSFQINMTGGQGFLVLALVIFGRWNIVGLVAGTLLFGGLDALQAYLTSIPGATSRVPHQLFDMLPYAATLAALAMLSRSKAGPLYLGRPWPEER